MHIDFVSDVVCPWCAVGLNSLEQALARVAPEIRPTLHIHPFELNPQMAPEGEDIAEHLGRKYGIGPAQVAANGEALRQRGAAVGFTFGQGLRRRIWNTFDAHRLLHWAGETDADAQRRLKHALLKAYFTDGRNPSDAEVLCAAAAEAGLDATEAAAVLRDGRYAAEVRAAEQFWHEQGISAVPAVVIDGRHLISGGQPPELFERALRHLAAEAAQAPGAASPAAPGG